VVIGDVLDDLGKEVAQSLGSRAMYVHHDVTQKESWSNFVTEAERAFGSIPVLVNNAGIFLVRPLLEISLEEYMRVIQVNQIGCFLGLQAVTPSMQAAGGGSIISISSIGGLAGIPGGIAYVASKFAIRGMTKVAALELGPLGIRVNSVHPGAVDTLMNTPASDGFEEAFGEGDLGEDSYGGLPLGRVSQPEELAHLVAFLASDESSYCTGSEFTADGGMLAGI